MSGPASAEQALGRIVSGIYVLTAGRDESGTGMLASWVQQCSFDPPMVTVALGRERPLGDLLGDGASFVINILGESDKPLLKHFAKGFAPDEPAFDGLEVGRSPDGVPVLPEAMGHLDCRVRGSRQAGDHRLIFAEVVGGRLTGDGPPMVHIRRSGSKY